VQLPPQFGRSLCNRPYVHHGRALVRLTCSLSGVHGAHLDVRMFVAVWPEDSARESVSRLELGPAQGLRLVRPEHWHVTLRFLGDVDDTLVRALEDALGVAVQMLAGPALCQIGPGTEWFSGDRVLQIPVAGLSEMASDVWSATVPVVPDLNHNEPPFTGHLTLARSARRRPDASTRAAVAGIPIAASFVVDHLDLVASELSADGPHYTTLVRLPLPS
jgi:RNA 2',3'-cyclic 3'-phosphodiesterase